MIDLATAYDVACRELGEARVQLAVLRTQLDEVTAERDEAGRRIVELTAEQPTA